MTAQGAAESRDGETEAMLRPFLALSNGLCLRQIQWAGGQFCASSDLWLGLYC